MANDSEDKNANGTNNVVSAKKDQIANSNADPKIPKTLDKSKIKSSQNSKSEQKKEVRKFWGAQDPLFNFYIGKNKIKVGDSYYITSEQVYQMEMAKHHNRHDIKKKIENRNPYI